MVAQSFPQSDTKEKQLHFFLTKREDKHHRKIPFFRNPRKKTQIDLAIDLWKRYQP